MADERRVGVAMDFSAGSKAALQWTIDNVLRDGDYLILFMVTKKDLEEGKAQLWVDTGSPLIPLSDLGDANLMSGYGVTVDSEAMAVLETVSKQKKVVVVGKVYYGDAREKLCDAAADFPLSCLVMGSRGLGPLKRVVVGSVSNYVVNNARCAVTVVKAAGPS